MFFNLATGTIFSTVRFWGIIFAKNSFSTVAPVVNVVKLFRGNLDFPKIKKLKKSLFWCLNLHKNVKTMNAILTQNFSLKLFIAF